MGECTNPVPCKFWPQYCRLDNYGDGSDVKARSKLELFLGIKGQWAVKVLCAQIKLLTRRYVNNGGKDAAGRPPLKQENPRIFASGSEAKAKRSGRSILPTG